MLYFIKLLFLLITFTPETIRKFILFKIDEETILNWLGIDKGGPDSSELEKLLNSSDGLDIVIPTLDSTSSTDISLKTLHLVMQGLWEKVQDGLTLSDIESTLFFLLFIRFLLIALRYNLKTSFYITCIGLFAGYLWYRHFIDLIDMYRTALLKLPFLHRLGTDGVELKGLGRQEILSSLKLGENAHWYNPGQVIYYAFIKGIIKIDLENRSKHYIDPISMMVSNLDESERSDHLITFYYWIYGIVIPKIFSVCTKFWTQLSGIAAYIFITRVGKKYCPYLIRWHWTFLLIISMIEPFLIYFVHRMTYFQTYVLLPKIGNELFYSTANIQFKIEVLNLIIVAILSVHFGIVLFGLLHAVLGQYFYFPFIVTNVELHVGRKIEGIYSGGNVGWQNPKQKEIDSKRKFVRLWYGWFGRGTSPIVNPIFPGPKFFIKSFFKILVPNRLRKSLKRKLKKIRKSLDEK